MRSCCAAVMLCCAVLCCAVLCCAVLCRAVLCRALLSCDLLLQARQGPAQAAEPASESSGLGQDFTRQPAGLPSLGLTTHSIRAAADDVDLSSSFETSHAGYAMSTSQEAAQHVHVTAYAASSRRVIQLTETGEPHAA